MFADAFHSRNLRRADAETRERFLRLSRRREIAAWAAMLAFWFLFSALLTGYLSASFLESFEAIARMACGGAVFAAGAALWLKTSREIGTLGVPAACFKGKLMFCSKLFYVLARWCVAAGAVALFDFVSGLFSETDGDFSLTLYLAPLLPLSGQAMSAMTSGDFSRLPALINSGDFFFCRGFAEWLLITFLMPSALFFRGLFLFLPLSAFFFRVAGTRERLFLLKKESL